MNKIFSASVKLGLLACSFFSGINARAIAQVTSDGTLDTQVNQNGNSAVITGGETRGGNLFHSFQDFSVGTGNEASFNNADSISNIFSRVTGGNISNIDGVIRANGSASLFLINPAGIIFGESARLDIGGSFYGSSASSILFEDGEFSAVDNLEQPILTINAPIGLNFRDNPGDITIRGDGNGTRLADSEPVDTQDALRVNGNATIGFIGGNLNFESATVKTAGGRIELGSVAGGRVDIVEVANGFSFDYSAIETFKDISLSGTSSVIDASGNGGGDINIAGRNIFINDSSGIEANTLGDETGGEINVFATDEISISGVENENNFISAITSRTFANATANGGDINIETGSLSIGDRAGIFTDTNGQGNAGNISINAADSVSLESQGNTSAINSGISIDAVGNGGNIDINSDSLTIGNGGRISSEISGQGNAGIITININDLAILSNPDGVSTISTAVNSNAVGNSADININATESIEFQGTENLVLINTANFNENENRSAGNINIATNLFNSNNGLLFTSNLGQGVSGNISIDATENISFNNNSFVFVQGTSGGAISIDAKNLSIASESSFLAGTNVDSQFSDIVSGDIVINLSEDLVLNGANNNGANNIDALTSIENSNFGQGSAGDIIINSRNINILNGAFIRSGTLSGGNIGNITLSATEDINLAGSNNPTSSNSSISNFIGSEATGNTGDIRVSAQNLTLTDGGEIQSAVQGRANSGDINLNIADTTTISGFAEFTDTTNGNEISRLSSDISSTVGLGAVGDGGDINIDTKNLFISRNGQISTGIVAAQGTGGDININAELITIGDQESPLLSKSNINSTTFRDLTTEEDSFTDATAGNIEINTGSLFIREGGNIDASTSNLGNAGNIEINASNTISVSGSSVLISDGDEVEIKSGIFSAVILDGIGNGGEITINTPQLSVNSGSQINAFSQGQGNAGSIDIDVDNLSVVDESEINAFTVGQGNAGSINITVNESIQFSNSSDIDAGAFEGSTGNGGNLSIETKRLNADGSSQISATTFGQGNAGNLTINASEFINLSGTSDDEGSTGLFASALVEDGNGGNLQISTGDLIIRDGAIVNVSNFPSVEGTTEPGTGEAGNLTVEANSLSIEDGGRINAATQAGNGGNITLDIADNITLRDTGLISARALKDANGGNINIDTNFIVAFPNGNNDIIANAERGNGGNININAEALFGIQQRPLNNFSNDINASSQFSLDGTVTIITPDLNSIQGEVNLPTNIIETEENTAQACRNNREAAAKNGLNITGKGGVVPDPALPLSSLNVTTNDGTNPRSAIPAPIETSQGKIQLARGIEVTESGIIRLTAHRTNNAGDRLTETRNCG